VWTISSIEKNTAQQKSELERTISHPQLLIPTLRPPVKVGNRTGTAEIPAFLIVSTKSTLENFFCQAQKIDNVSEPIIQTILLHGFIFLATFVSSLSKIRLA
jgi:hypothetical protein